MISLPTIIQSHARPIVPQMLFSFMARCQPLLHTPWRPCNEIIEIVTLYAFGEVATHPLNINILEVHIFILLMVD